MTQNISKQVSRTGVVGLDEVLAGGFPRNYLYLIQGNPGTGKTTLAMQFLIEGARQGENVLYITFSETKSELESVAHSHGWDLSNVNILELSSFSANLIAMTQNTLFHASEMELNNVIKLLLNKVKEVNATRIVFDSVSELRLLAETSLRYRRQMLAFKDFFIGRGSTVLFLDDMTSEAGDLHVQSIVHGVLLLESHRMGYGVEQRSLHVVKLRGVGFSGGTHDYIIKKGGIHVFPRLIAKDHSYAPFKPEQFSSGLREMDALIGGGLDRGTSNLILGPAGSGKSTITLQFAVAAAARGKKVAIYNFEENVNNFIYRAATLKMDIESYLKNGTITIRKIQPSELTPGQFAALVREAIDHKVDMVVIDSLNGYLHAMPEQNFLILQLHELLSYLNGHGVVSLMILSQAGIMGAMKAPLDLTYLADTVVLTRFFEAFGKVKKALSIIKKRTGLHEDTLREFKIGEGGVSVGKVLSEFAGIFSGVPRYTGPQHKIMVEDNE